MKPLKEKYKQLEDEGKALLAVNFYNFETLAGTLQATKERNSSIILQATSSSINYMGLPVTVGLAKYAREQFGVEAWLHLDHANDIELIKRCLDAGFDSVMIDASEEPYERNIELSQKVVSLAEPYGANVEAELGYVAKLGQNYDKVQFTQPDEARAFVNETGVNALAVAIGSAHGFYKEEPKLDLELLAAIHEVTPAALVLHGGSGIPADQLKGGIERGIRKINVATEVKNTFMQTLKEDLKTTDEIDLRKVFPSAINEVKKLIEGKLDIINS
ncbi:class II fructose-bisphosphate aldolase [Gracilimonas mengyeensis]|uniref:Fructose-bisphosphate aldolase, class II/tagatose 1,6-diphosphate aldolase GatY/KbaY n=1 Tax=Gracilimonas mengyeensis TaxID=1302730 RepID=A0A521BTP5_9BACT|nr:class II fructose-bisphosphate aldolase [Gracilimonas mengyeensis]SMO50529.1 fructose-bisphosphate aldolase, class II/tagatose 1,6-diphosphate aldolase GatY/KbaY [Gracilimonas mengyeensis]